MGVRDGQRHKTSKMNSRIFDIVHTFILGIKVNRVSRTCIFLLGLGTAVGYSGLKLPPAAWWSVPDLIPRAQSPPLHKAAPQYLSSYTYLTLSPNEDEASCSPGPFCRLFSA